MKMMNMFKRQDGVSLLEAMLFLVVAALVLMMALRYFSQASLNSKINSVYDQQMGIAGAADNYLTQNPKATSVAMSDLTDNGYLGAGMIKNAFNGDNTVSFTSGSGVTEVTSSNIPTDACTSLIKMIQSNIAGAKATCDSNTLTTDIGAGKSAIGTS